MDAKIEAAIKNANSGLKKRTVGSDEAVTLEKLMSERPEASTIRVYSQEGFLPNAYKWQAKIAYLEAYKDADTGEWVIHGARCDAKRSHGAGALATVNGRAA